MCKHWTSSSESFRASSVWAASQYYELQRLLFSGFNCCTFWTPDRRQCLTSFSQFLLLIRKPIIRLQHIFHTHWCEHPREVYIVWREEGGSSCSPSPHDSFRREWRQTCTTARIERAKIAAKTKQQAVDVPAAWAQPDLSLALGRAGGGGSVTLQQDYAN